MAALAAFAFANLLLAVSHSTGSPQGQRGVRQIAAFRIRVAPHRPLGGNLSSAALRPLPVLRCRVGSCQRLRAALRNLYCKPSLEEFSSCRVDVGVPVVSHLSLDGTEEPAQQCRPSGGSLCPGVASLACSPVYLGAQVTARLASFPLLATRPISALGARRRGLVGITGTSAWLKQQPSLDGRRGGRDLCVTVRHFMYHVNTPD